MVMPLTRLYIAFRLNVRLLQILNEVTFRRLEGIFLTSLRLENVLNNV